MKGAIHTAKSAEIYHNTKVKSYPNGLQKVTVCTKPIFKDKGWEERKKDTETGLISKPKDMTNEVRDDSLRRAKTAVFDISMLNEFTHFVTWTLDPGLINRYDPKEVSKKLKRFLTNMQQRYCLKYLVVAEHHKDGAIHMHGLISGNMKYIDSCTRLIPNHKKPVSIQIMKRYGLSENSDGVRIVYNMPQWSLGYSTAIELTGDTERIANYITKYISKDFKKIFGSFYYAGGTGLIRKPSIQLYDINYADVNAKEYTVEAVEIGFKYFTLNGE